MLKTRNIIISVKSTWLLLLTSLIIPTTLLSQESFTVSKPRLELSNENLVIEYDIRSSDPSDEFNVWIEVTDASGNPTTITAYFEIKK